MDKLTVVLDNPVLRYAYLQACQYREIDEREKTIAGRKVGRYKFECTQKLIAGIVYDNHNPL